MAKSADAVVRKKDAFTYMTSDLACIQYRDKEWHADCSSMWWYAAAQHFKTLPETANAGLQQGRIDSTSPSARCCNDGKTLSTQRRCGGSKRTVVGGGRARHENTSSYAKKIERGEEATEFRGRCQQIASRVGIGAVIR